MTAHLNWPCALDLLALHRLDPQRYPFLLESLAHDTAAGRYDLLLASPQEHLQLRDGQLQHKNLSIPGLSISPEDDFFAVLDHWVAQLPVVEPENDLPFSGGWFLLLGYEAAATIEPSLALPTTPHRLPDALAVRCPAGISRDHRSKTCTLVAETPDLLRSLENDCRKIGMQHHRSEMTDNIPRVSASVTESDPERFLTGVRRVLEYLHAGDIFQTNLSRAWQGQLPAAETYLDLYQRLRTSNPAPFAGLAYWQGSAVLSSSPERLLTIDKGVAQTRPIAGTHARMADITQDQQQGQRLIADLKERAEHLMLIDLERNDLGRVCIPGSVDVDELMVLVSYRHVHHIVSNLRGRLRSGVGAGAALRAVFPGGTITGCPKVRAMQIIAELEAEGRGPYTGGMGYLSRCGRLDTNILIRTVICEGRDFTLRAGAGIVADSDPQTELAETRAKARGMLQALGGGDEG